MQVLRQLGAIEKPRGERCSADSVDSFGLLSFQTRLFLRFGGARLGSSVGDFVWLAGPQLEILHGQSMKKTSDCSTTDLLSG